MVQPNQALPEGIPLGQADGCQLGAIYMARIGHYKIERTSVNSFRLVQIETWSRRSLAPVR